MSAESIVRLATAGPALLDGIACACGLVAMMAGKLEAAGIEFTDEERTQLVRSGRTIDAALNFANQACVSQKPSA